MSKPLKSFRVWLTPQEDTGSFVLVAVNQRAIDLTLADCYRRIEWSFCRDDPKALAKARRKIAKVKVIIDAVHAELHS